MLLTKKQKILGDVNRYFYKGEIDLNKLDGGLCVNLLKAAEHFGLDEFREELQHHIIYNKTLWLQHNFIRVVNGVFVRDGDERIRHHLDHKINDNPWYLLTTNEFILLKSSCIISLMDDECFIVNQGIVWDIIIKWGIQQCSTLRFGEPNWTYEDWMTLKGAVEELIPYVKFSRISRNDYYGKILPYNKIISVKENLEHEEVLIYYLDKDVMSSHSKLLGHIFLDDSSIINHFHANLILQWINESRDKENENETFLPYSKIRKSSKFLFFKKKRQKQLRSITYQFNLLFRRSRDGFPTEDHRKRCDNLPNTLVIVKPHNSKGIVGGFAPRGLAYTPAIGSSFLFNFKNGDPSMENTILCKMRKDKDIESEYIPYLWTGPRFGVRDLAIDLHQMKATSVPQYYDKPVHDDKEFDIDDVEVYQIV